MEKCRECKHFIMHYFYLRGRYLKTDAGGCRLRKYKDVQALKECARWEKAAVPTKTEALSDILLRLSEDLLKLRGILRQNDGGEAENR